MPTHAHSVSATATTTGAHTHTANSANAHKHDSGVWRIWDSANGPYGTSVESTSVSYPVARYTNGSAGSDRDYTSTVAAHTHTTNAMGDHSHTITVSETEVGGSAQHNNMQPYLAVAIWKRTA